MQKRPEISSLELWLVSIEPLRSRPKKMRNEAWTFRKWDYRVTFDVEEPKMLKARISVEVGGRTWEHGRRENHPSISAIESEARAKVREFIKKVRASEVR